MTSDPFSTPSSGERIQDFDGHLLLVMPTEYVSGIETAYGDTDAVDADVVVLDDEDGAQRYDGMRVFPGALVGALKKHAQYNDKNGSDPKTGFPRMTLGRLGKGEAKKGQSAPWALSPPTEDDKVKARDWIAANLTKEDGPF